MILPQPKSTTLEPSSSPFPPSNSNSMIVRQSLGGCAAGWTAGALWYVSDPTTRVVSNVFGIDNNNVIAETTPDLFVSIDQSSDYLFGDAILQLANIPLLILLAVTPRFLGWSQKSNNAQSKQNMGTKLKSNPKRRTQFKETTYRYGKTTTTRSSISCSYSSQDRNGQRLVAGLAIYHGAAALAFGAAGLASYQGGPDFPGFEALHVVTCVAVLLRSPLPKDDAWRLAREDFGMALGRRKRAETTTTTTTLDTLFQVGYWLAVLVGLGVALSPLSPVAPGSVADADAALGNVAVESLTSRLLRFDYGMAIACLLTPLATIVRDAMPAQQHGHQNQLTSPMARTANAVLGAVFAGTAATALPGWATYVQENGIIASTTTISKNVAAVTLDGLDRISVNVLAGGSLNALYAILCLGLALAPPGRDTAKDDLPQ